MKKDIKYYSFFSKLVCYIIFIILSNIHSFQIKKSNNKVQASNLIEAALRIFKILSVQIKTKIIMKLIFISIFLLVLIVSINSSPSSNSQRYRSEELSEYEDSTDLQRFYEDVLNELGGTETTATVTEIKPKQGWKSFFKSTYQSVKNSTGRFVKGTKEYFVNGRNKLCKYLYENRVFSDNIFKPFCGDPLNYS